MNVIAKDSSMTSTLRFDGSVWCNLDIALRNIDQLFTRVIQPLGLSVIEWYILRALYDQDGQHASELARSVGRAATSFTPNLDKLQSKGMIERRPDPSDRRAVRIFLTDKAENRRSDIIEAAEALDGRIANLFEDERFEAFQAILSTLQGIELD
jgi:MarR family transcriptional regulator, organic hydroperoxide resistance regulator